VLMPEHFHVLIWPSPEADPSRILKSLKPRTARFMATVKLQVLLSERLVRVDDGPPGLILISLTKPQS
ncbi:MAG: hypothetical protein ACRD3O_17950, partial [Terriglobia bacterium]